MNFSNIYDGNFDELILKINESLKNEEKEFIITANTEIYSLDHLNIKKILNNRKYIVVCDGIRLKNVVEKILNKPIQKITGIDISTNLLEMANKNKHSLYVYGSSKENINKLSEVLKIKYPNINVLGLDNGFTNKSKDVAAKIASLKPDIILVALGVPKQELFIFENYNKFEKGIFIGVGGSLDVISGLKSRAPKLFIKMNLEWLYRIMKEPKRISKFISSNIKFYLKVRGIKK